MKNPLLLYVVFWLWKMANVAIHFKFVRVQEHNYSKFWPFCLCKFPPVKILLFKIISILLLDGFHARRQIFSICIPSEEILIAFHASLPTNQVKSKSPFRKQLLSKLLYPAPGSKWIPCRFSSPLGGPYGQARRPLGNNLS